jgi:hypothetical protein
LIVQRPFARNGRNRSDQDNRQEAREGQCHDLDASQIAPSKSYCLTPCNRGPQRPQKRDVGNDGYPVPPGDRLMVVGQELQLEKAIKAEIAAPAALKEKRSRRPAGAPSASGKSSARAHRLTSALRLRHMRQFDAAQTWRSRNLLARMRAAPLGAK